MRGQRAAQRGQAHTVTPSWSIGKKPRRKNEAVITAQIRMMLKQLRIPHFKHFGGPMAAPGVADLIGTIPGSGRALFIEVKAEGLFPKPHQRVFLDTHAQAGALAFYADDPWDVVRTLAKAEYAPAVAMLKMMPK